MPARRTDIPADWVQRVINMPPGLAAELEATGKRMFPPLDFERVVLMLLSKGVGWTQSPELSFPPITPDDKRG